MPVHIVRDTGDKIVTFASGATQSGIVAVQGYALATAFLPAGLKGNLRYRVAVTDQQFRSGIYSRLGDDVSTGITQAVVGVGKPAAVALRPEALVCRALKLSMSSAQTALKTVHIRVMG